MNRQLNSIRFFAGLGAAIIIILAQSGWAAPVLKSLLPSSAHYGVIKTQRIRFDNAPLFRKANEAENAINPEF